MLLETLSIEVGSSIAKSILKLWLKDSDIVFDTTSSLLDMLKSFTTDQMAQRRADRLLVGIGQRVGESLQDVFNIDGAQLDEATCNAVALAVAEALNTISATAVAQHNFEPSKLAKHLLQIHPASKQFFSETEAKLYERIISESCQYIVDIASQLPSFSERTFAEVLKREIQILERAQNILDEVQRLRNRLDPKEEASRFELQYRRAIVRHLDVLQLFGLDVANASRRYRLSVAYITLSVTTNAQRDDTRSNQAMQMNNVSSIETQHISKSPKSKFINDNLPAEKLLADLLRRPKPLLLIRGGAGSGKTTLLQWLAVNTASQSFKGELASWNTKLPFYIPLRQCVETNLPSPQDFPKFISPLIVDMMPRGWVVEQLRSGHAVVLVDGLDEIPSSKRNKVYAWLKELAEGEEYSGTCIIVTSRPYAVDEMQLNKFHKAELQPMELSDIRAFIDHWHAAVAEELQDSHEKSKLLSFAEHLKETLKTDRPKRNLATNPLLCAMLCALNRERGKQLPSDRIELYEMCCRVLIERRDLEREILLTDYPAHALSYRQKLALLEDLAYWLIKNGWSEVELERISERFERKLRTMIGSQSFSGTDVSRLFVERTSIIREPVKGLVDFTHRTFQEFLAAKAAVEEGDIGILVQNAHNDQWREVIILASGLAHKKDRENLLNELLRRGDSEMLHRYQIHLLAVACLETPIHLEEPLLSNITERLNTLVPPRNTADVNSLAAAGELAIPYLTRRREYTPEMAVACVRALATIGGNEAIEALEQYVNGPIEVLNELFKVWGFFDTEAYGQRILSRFKQGVRITSLNSLVGFQYFQKVTSLDLSNYWLVSHLGPLSGLAQLKSLNLASCKGIYDLRPLTPLTQLTWLNLSNCEKLGDLTPLKSLTQLRLLDLSNCKRVRDLSPLAGLTHLNTLRLHGCTGISDLSPLAGLTQLRALDLSRCNQISDLSPLEGLANLRQLSLYYFPPQVFIPESLERRQIISRTLPQQH